MVKIMENPIKFMICGYPYFWKHPHTLPETKQFAPENGPGPKKEIPLPAIDFQG